MLLMAVVPISVSAATSAAKPEARFDPLTLMADVSKPTIGGTATSSKSVQIIVRKEGESKTLFKKSSIKVKDGAWQTKVTKKLADGRYDIELKGTDAKGKNLKTLATGTLLVGYPAANAKVAATLVVAPVPLLRGGAARTGASVPISYLQVTNVGKIAATIKGFLLKQNGTASGSAVIGLSSVDDKGGSRANTASIEGVTPFVAGAAYAPTDATLQPGEMKLFTVRAIMSKNVSAYLGRTLMIDVTGLDTNAGTVQGVFPIRGTTLTVSN